MSAYILIALRFEERDLVEHIGEPYRRYQEEVPALIPRPGRTLSGQVRGTG
jgi:protein-S-isoprenylcysteine O-methyltransferase Ste14